jgi:hypothetical protein
VLLIILIPQLNILFQLCSKIYSGLGNSVFIPRAKTFITHCWWPLAEPIHGQYFCHQRPLHNWCLVEAAGEAEGSGDGDAFGDVEAAGEVEGSGESDGKKLLLNINCPLPSNECM